jgi:hypothetical protein
MHSSGLLDYVSHSSHVLCLVAEDSGSDSHRKTLERVTHVDRHLIEVVTHMDKHLRVVTQCVFL